MRCVSLMVLLAAALISPSGARSKDLSFDDRVELLRGLTAEYATAKALLPRSKNALLIDDRGLYDRQAWDDAAKEHGPAARVGDLIQIEDTLISILPWRTWMKFGLPSDPTSITAWD